ncbi:hypothetical protein Pcinc_001995 [Petrolisthes cinctipes]|uniref:Uncharacterized protein n=1 Tax=Petrolisthes cinctipes TaxID=88211 RepID=A0AAE1L3F0_PETCI|nr:hypothetical protein Pcinc_001995 [Petrolisthes cinctipes]
MPQARAALTAMPKPQARPCHLLRASSGWCPRLFAALAAKSTPRACAAIVDTAILQARASLAETSTTNLLVTPPLLPRSAMHTTPTLPHLS